MDWNAIPGVLAAAAGLGGAAWVVVAFVLDRPHVHLERALKLSKELPEGDEQRAWAEIVRQESAAIRAWRDPKGRREVRQSWSVLLISLLGIVMTMLNVGLNGWTPEAYLLIAFAAGIAIAVFSLRRESERREAVRNGVSLTIERADPEQATTEPESTQPAA